MVNTYISQFDYTRSPAGLEYASLLGNSLRLAGPVLLGVSSLSIIPALTVQLNPNDRVTIFDGPNSEVGVVATTANVGQTSILFQSGVQFAHVINTPLCSDGILGSLADQIVNASAWVENITKQVLWSTTQTETLRMPTMRASIDNRNILTFRTKQYPITAISALQIGTNQSTFVSYDATQAFIDSNELVTVPQLQATGAGSSTYSLIAQQVNRTQNAYLNVTYTAGFTVSTMPGDVKDATILLTSALLSRRMNPIGADGYDLGDRRIQATQRGDPSPDSLLVKDAKQKLAQYTLRMF